MAEIKLLDCTLRDGGYINNWNFGEEQIDTFVKKMPDSGIDILELGFLKNEEYDVNRTVFNRIEQITSLIKPKSKKIQYAAMIEVINPVSCENISDRSDETIDIIRVIIWKRLMREGYEYCRELAKKGYQICIQPARVEQYSEEEFVEMLQLFSTIDPMAIYIVDSFGTQSLKDIKKYYELADNTLPTNIKIGYHGHNNLLQVYDIAVMLAEQSCKREIIIDASIFGMGRGAGNLNLELFGNYCNSVGIKKVDNSILMYLYDECISKIYSKHSWGYTLPLFLSGIYGCNPNFALYYDEKGVNSETIEDIFAQLVDDEKIIFSSEKAEQYLKKYS